MSRTVGFFMVMLLSLSLPLDARGHTVVTRMSDMQSVTLSEVAAAAGTTDLILVGEVHTNKEHHDMQLALIRSLAAAGLPLAIGLEMIQADSQQQLDQWVSGKMKEEAMEAVFNKNWSSDWPMYRDIFRFARDRGIPMVALNVPIEIVRKVSRHGFESLTPEERKNLPEGTSCDLRNPQVALLKKSFQGIAVHGMNGKSFDHFCEAQTVRNSGMAINMNRFIQKNPGRKVVVLTGIFHAVKYAIPEELERNGSKMTHTVIIPATPELNSTNATASEADYMVDM